MNGELWQSCSAGRCRVEPVCSICERCEKHCCCEQTAQDAVERAAFEREYPGFLDALERHRAQGAQERD